MSQLFELINNFITGRKVSQGGYAPVTKQEIHDINHIIEKLLELKYERDSDGALPITWAIVDRTKYYNPFLRYSQLEYPSNAQNDEGVYDMDKLYKDLDSRLNILDIAIDELNMIRRYIAEVKRDVQSKKLY